MTVLTYVSQAEMKRRTGFGKALGYSFPQKDEILVRKGLSKDVKTKVLAHEEEHIINDEEGPFLDKLLNFIPVVGPILGTVASLIGGKKSSGSQTNASATAAAGSERELQFHRESRDLARADQAPYREAGTTALAALMSMTGLGGGPQTMTQRALANPNITPEQRAWHNQYPDVATDGSPMTQGDRFNIPEGVSAADWMNQRYQDGVDAGVFDFPNGGSTFEEKFGRAAFGRAMGGPTSSGNMYNINEMGPENVYSRGAMTRNPNPMTIDGQTGYVQPNIQGRYAGGVMGAAMMGNSRFRQMAGQQSGGMQPGNQGGIAGMFRNAQSQMGGMPGRVGGVASMMRNAQSQMKGQQSGYQGGMASMFRNAQSNIKGRYAGGPMGEEFAGGAYMPPGRQAESPPQVGYSPPQVSQGGVPASGGAVNPGIDAGGVMENPGGVEGGYNFMTDPGYNFRMDEGVRAMDRSAAARGGLLSGGYGRKLTRYAQDYASGEYNNVYNRISNIAGLGQVSAGQSGGYAVNAGAYMGNAASNAANASAYGQVGAGSAWANAANQIAQLPWDKVFNKAPTPQRGAPI